MIKLIESCFAMLGKSPARRSITTGDLLEQMSILEFILVVESFASQVHHDFVHMQNKILATNRDEVKDFYHHDANLDCEELGYLKTLEANFKSLLEVLDDNTNEKLEILIAISNIEGRVTYNASQHISKIEANSLIVHLTEALNKYLCRFHVKAYLLHDTGYELQSYARDLIKLYRKTTTNVFSLKDVQITSSYS